jgi:hypothetical protein
VYAYVKNDLQDWTLSKFKPAELNYGDDFGYRVDVFEDTFVATAPDIQHENSSWTGSVYAFRKNSVGWSQAAKLTVHDPMDSGRFGTDVALSDGRLIVGASTVSQRGGAYIFEENEAGQWMQTAELIPHDIEQRYFFGAEVSLFGNMAAVTAHGTTSRIVYIFQYDGGDWQEIGTLTSDQTDGSFGSTLAAHGEQVFVASGLNAPGAVHVFTRVPEPHSLTILLGFLSYGLICQRRLNS